MRPKPGGLDLHPALHEAQEGRETVLVHPEVVDAGRWERCDAVFESVEAASVDVELGVPAGEVVDAAGQPVEVVRAR